MPTVRGSGRLQQAILAQLDGQARVARELIEEIAGGEPTRAQYNALNRACHSLIASGQLAGWHEPGQRGHRQLLVRRVDRWISDSGTFAEREQATDKLQAVTDEAWAAFRLDCSYAALICEAAIALAEHPRDGDSGHASEGGPAQIQPGVRPRSR